MADAAGAVRLAAPGRPPGLEGQPRVGPVGASRRARSAQRSHGARRHRRITPAEWPGPAPRTRSRRTPFRDHRARFARTSSRVGRRSQADRPWETRVAAGTSSGATVRGADGDTSEHTEIYAARTETWAGRSTLCRHTRALLTGPARWSSAPHGRALPHLRRQTYAASSPKASSAVCMQLINSRADSTLIRGQPAHSLGACVDEIEMSGVESRVERWSTGHHAP